jgi:hypothetical protein
MRVAIMQPYFFPYIGYFQLIAAVDLFIVYDNIKYTKKGWINRNRILVNGKDEMFSLPIKGDSDSLNIDQRELASDFNREKLLNKIAGAYRRAPFFANVFPLVEEIIEYNESNLFDFLHHSIVKTCAYLQVTTEIRTSSGVAIDHSLTSQNKVLAICQAVGANAYVNAIGGKELYSSDVFHTNGLTLKFIQSKPFEYAQFGDAFVPWLSIVDVMMFCPQEDIRKQLIHGFQFLEASI